MEDDYYQILSVVPTASQEEIIRRYRFLVLAYHPDRFSEELKAEASQEMARINRAYEVLSDPLKRSSYDQKRSSLQAAQRKSGGGTTVPTSESETSYSSTYRTGYQENNNRVNEAFQYFEGLISRWGPYIQNVSQNPQRELIFNKCKDTIRVISEKLSVYLGEQGKALFLEEMDKYLAAVIVINVALGIELEASSPPVGYTGQDLMEYSIVPIRSQISFVMDYGKSRGAYTQDQVIALNHQAASELRTLCQAYQQEGRSIAAALRVSPNKTASEGTTRAKQSQPIFQYCQNCGSIGPTKKLTFVRMIGLVFFARFRRVDGELCAACAVKYFWEYTGMTLLLGWISLLSVVLPFIILANWINYHKSGDIRKNASNLSEIAGGWKTFTILATLAVILAFLAFLSTSQNQNAVSSNNSNSYVYQPTFAPQKTPTSRLKSSATSPMGLLVYPTDDGCVSWNKVTSADKGKKLCVYGVVKNAYWGDTDRFFMTFSGNNSAFRMIVLWGYYYEDVIGECVEATGIIKTYENMPYIELGQEILIYETTVRCLE